MAEKAHFSRCKGQCKGHKKRCKGHVQGPHIPKIEMGARAAWICARASDVCKGLIFCLLKFWKILRPLHLFLWPLHMALALLLVALALALAPRKMLLFGRLSGICIAICISAHGSIEKQSLNFRLTKS